MARQQNRLVAVREKYATIRAAVFRIDVDPTGRRRVGTGFFISPSGYALTALHNVPCDVRDGRHGEVQGWDVAGNRLRLKFIPIAGDAQSDIALLQACDGGPYPHLRLGAVRSGLADTARMHFWALRGVVVFGYPLHKGEQVEHGMAGHVPGDFPVRTSLEEDCGAEARIERLRIAPDHIEELAGISGGPVVDIDTGLVVAVTGAQDQNLLLGSALRPWPPGAAAPKLPIITELPLRQRWTLIAAAAVVVFAAIALGSALLDIPVRPNRALSQASTTSSSIPADRAPAVSSANDPPRSAAGETTTPQDQPVPPLSGKSACDIAIVTRLPYDEFGGPHTCGNEISGTLTPSSRPRDVMLFVTAGRDAPVTRFQGRITVRAGEGRWRISSCTGTRYVVAVVDPGAPKELDGADLAIVPVAGEAGISCVKTFEGQREP